MIHRVGVAAAIALAACVLAPLAAHADPIKVAVLPIAGSDGTVETAVERALRGECELIRVSDWEAAAKRLFATGKGASDIAAVAADVGAQVVVTGTIKNDGAGFALALSVRSGRTGKKVEKLGYPLASQEVDPATLKRVVAEIGPSVKRASAATATSDGGDGDEAPRSPAAPPPAPAAKPATTQPAGEPAAAVATEPAPVATTLVPSATPRDTGAAPVARESTIPYIDAVAGLIVSGRNLVFTPRTQPFFASTVAEGLHLDLTGYPLSTVSLRALQGLGVGLLLDSVFWPDAVPCARDDSGACMPTTERYGVRELRWEAGLRWRWNPVGRDGSPEVMASAQFGQHALTVQKRMDGTNVGPPDTAYTYITLGVGGRVPLGSHFAIHASFQLHALLGAGPITAITEYGAGGGTGLRAGGGIEVRIVRGLVARVEGFYERFGLAFDGAMADKMATGGVDQYYGGMVSAGYVWQRPGKPIGGAPVVTDGDGDGVPDAEDRCPAAAGPRATGGCPDGDGDGVPDPKDRCPRVAGPAALGGCPDGDGDGLADVDDDCPSVPGDAQNRGCPTYKTIKVKTDRIELDGKIFFAYDKTDILPKSHELLDEIAQALIDHPAIRVRVMGHTDASGSEKHNQELSEGRARAVMDYLVGKGIDAGRLESKGFGSQYPVDSNKTQSGRENNRRVEFLIVKESGGASSAEPGEPQGQ